MKVSRWKKIRVGVLVTLASIIVLVFIMLIDERGGIFASYSRVKAYFKTVSGLRVGAIVYLLGVDVGEVNRIFYEGEGVVVEMDILSKVLDRIPSDSVALIKTQGLLGDKMIEIRPGTSSTPIQEGGVLRGESEGEIYENVARAGVVVRKAARIVEELEEILREIRLGKGSIGKFFKDDTLYENVNKTASNLNMLVVHLSKTSERLQEFIDSVNEQLVQKGTFKKLSDTAAQLNLAVSDLRSIILSLKEGRGTAGKVIKDEEFYNSLTSVVKELKILINDIKENPSRYMSIKIF